MIVSFTLAWWHIPLGVSLLGLAWIVYWFWRDLSEGGMFTGIGGAIASIPALIVMLLAWMVGGLYK
jgi:hypothetical protein